MAKWGRNPSGGRPEFLPAEDIRLIGSPVYEMGNVDPNTTNEGIPPNAAMNVRRRGDFATDPPAGGAEEPAASAVGPTSGTLTGDVMAGLSPEDQAAVKKGMEGWMSQFDKGTQGQILEELPDYGANKPEIQEQVITPAPELPAAVPEPPAAPAAPAAPTVPDAPLTAAQMAALSNMDNQNITLTGGGGQNNQGLKGWTDDTGGQGPGGPGNQGIDLTDPYSLWNLNPNVGPAGPAFDVGEMAYRTDPFGVYSAMRAKGTPYDPTISTMSGYRSALGRGFQPTYGRYTLAPDVQGVGSFAEFLGDPNRQRAETDVLRQRFMDVAGQLTGRSEVPLGQQGRYARYFDPNTAEDVGTNLVNAALASAGGPSIFNDALRSSLANRYAMYQAQDPNPIGMGAARQFSNYVAGQYSPTWGQGQPMASMTPPPTTYEDPFTEGAYVGAGLQGGATNGNAFNGYLNNGNLWETM